MKRFAITALMLSCLCCALLATSYTIDLGLPTLKSTGDYTKVNISGGQLYAQPGEPALPWLASKLLLPLGEEAGKITVKMSNPHRFKLDKPIQPADANYPFSMKEVPPPFGPDEKIYTSETPWPAVNNNGVNTQFLAGHPINFTAYCPFEYYPLTNELVFYQSVSITVESHSSSRAQAALALLKQDAFISERLKSSVDNIDQLPSYRNRQSGADYLIIHATAKTSQWTALKDFYAGNGLVVAMQTVENIQTQVAGADLQEKIRNYIISVYQNNPLQYVVLAGDTDVIPHRGFYVNMGQADQVDNDIPADMYYSCLDGNWNSNGNSQWGEPLEADLAPELALGRICYNNDTEIANQISKIMFYQIAPVENEVKTAFFAGEWLWEGPTWGGDYMDEMIGGSSANGYTTVGVPTNWNITTLYDRTYGYEDAWNANTVRPILSQGPNLVNHLGHSFTNYAIRCNNNQVSETTITNNGSNHNYSIYFTQGCYAGAFDNRTTNTGEYVADCITEKFTSISTAAVSMIAHSRYGWGVQGSTDGASQHFHRQYIDALFGENINDLGWALVDSKIDNIPYITNNPVMYWVTYETNLIGDPALSVWTDTPQVITAQMPPMWSMPILNYQVATNAPFAMLRIKDQDTILCEAQANEMGLININLFQGLAPGSYQLYITAPNFYVYNSPITVEASDMPYVVATNIQVQDADGLYHTGEEISLGCTLKNMGTVNQVNDGSVSLNSNSPNIQILSPAISFEAIAQGDSLVFENAFQIKIVGNFEDGKIVNLVLNTSFDGYSANSNKMLTLNAPDLKLAGHTISNVNPTINPGESPIVNLTMENNGSGNAYAPTMALFCDNPAVNLSHFEVSFPTINAGEQLTQAAAFYLTIPPDIDAESTINIGYLLYAENGSVKDGQIVIHMGFPIHSFESDMMGWTTYTLSENFNNQWHRSNYRNHTPAGSYSMKFGGEGGTNYGNRAYGALESPEFTLGKNSVLTFYHRMDAENHNSNPQYAWDGGFLQMKHNGGAWTQITPAGGYPYRIYNNPASPLNANTYCWSGFFDWTLATFDLSQYSGRASFRFVFGSDGAANAEGWYIDDVRLVYEYEIDADDPVACPALSLKPNYPNPFNPSTTISFNLPGNGEVKLDVFNLKGQRVRRLIDSSLTLGEHSIIFNGLDDHGRPVASGIYLYRLQHDGKTITRKMMLMK
ncbi:MAG TPA: C25 family cysteine peptidase [Candidatus Cloacimonadota bacterium]|nr:C25 family cysteine peptidase [Candidatus Cloacimonadota bacterium]